MTSHTVMPPPTLEVRHVLVPLDGSELALQAMPTARVLADRFGAELQTISVAGADDEITSLRAMATSALGVDVGNDRAWVVTAADAAAEIVRRPEPLSARRIVAGVDGSGSSEAVLPMSAAWAQKLGMSLSILTVVDDQPPPARAKSRSRYGPGADAEIYIAELVQAWRDAVSEVDGVIVRDPIGLASGIRAHLDMRPAGLVAVTTHARSGTQRMMGGAAAANIVHASVAPCLVVPIGP